MTASKNPKLRFKDENGKDFTDWIIKDISSLIKEVNTKTKVNNQFPVLSSTLSGIYLQTEYFDKQVASENNIGYKIVNRGNFTYRSMSDNGIFRFNIQNLIETGIVSPAYPVFEAIQSIVLPEYLYLYLNSSNNIKDQLLKSKQGGTRYALNISKFKKLQILVPKLLEQKKIAEFLTSVDNYIQNLISQKEELEKYKKAMMQKIFSQQLRFKDTDGSDFPDWTKEKLGKICKITTGKLDANAMVKGGKYRFYTCAKDYFEIDKYAFDTEALLISGNGANVGYIHYYIGKFNAYQRTYVLYNFKSEILYIKFYLDKYLSARIESEKKAGNTPYIVMSTLSDMEIFLPTVDEQRIILKFFINLDKNLNIKENQIKLAEEWKKGLMQQMFI